MSFIYRTLTAIVFVAFAEYSAAGSAPPLRKGLWEITTTPAFKGIPAIPRPQIDRLCLTENDIRKGTIAVRTAASCKILEGKWEANVLSLAVFCPDAPPDARIPAELNAAHDAFTSYIELNEQIKYQHSGKWLSDQCQ